MTDPDVLSAIGCHTTLRPNASALDQVVFLADKLSWDQDGEPPFLSALIAALEESINAGCLAYIDWLLSPQGGIRVIHPWLRAAYQSLLSIPFS